MKVTFVICKHIFATVLGLICSMVNRCKVRYATDVLHLDIIGLAPRRDRLKEAWELFIPIWDVLIHKKCLKRKMDMNDQEMPSGQVIMGPWSGKGVRKVKLPDKDIIELQQKAEFAEELAKSLIVQMIHTMSENTIDISENSFIRDMAMIIEMVHGTISRDLGLEHPSHKFMEEFVDVVVNTDNSVETDVDFVTISKLANMLEDDDDPEIS
jgi:hypothetical protein